MKMNAPDLRGTSSLSIRQAAGGTACRSTAAIALDLRLPGALQHLPLRRLVAGAGAESVQDGYRRDSCASDNGRCARGTSGLHALVPGQRLYFLEPDAGVDQHLAELMARVRRDVESDRERT